MKNLCIALALMLTGTFAFANSDVEAKNETAKESVVVENVQVVNEVSLDTEEASCGFTVIFNTDDAGSGSFWMECDDDTTMDDIFGILFELFW